MATWPFNLPKPQRAVGYDGGWQRKAIKTPSDAGYIQTRARATRSTSSFRLGWAFISVQDFFVTFKQFWDEVSGAADSFDWEDELQTPKASYTVRFQADSIRWKMVSPTAVTASFSVEEE